MFVKTVKIVFSDTIQRKRVMMQQALRQIWLSGVRDSIMLAMLFMANRNRKLNV